MNRKRSRTNGNNSGTANGSVTMREVADHVGVSMMTVSRVLNNEMSVRQATREKVLEAVKTLGYRPNISARSLATQRSCFLGLIYDNPSASYMSEFLIGALGTCRESGYHLVVEACGDVAVKWADEILEMVKESQLDGVIMPPPVCDDHAVLDALQKAGVPHVRISPGKDVKDSPVVFIDDRRAAREMTNYLIQQGHKDIGFIAGHPNQDSSRLRYEGFNDAMEAHGLTVRGDRVIQGYYSYKSGFAASERLLGNGNPPTAIFASNDDMAAAVYANAQRYKLSVPDELSVVGFDDTPTATLVWPALTTIRQPISEMAAAAIDLLVQYIQGGPKKPPRERELDFELIARDSVVPPR